MNTHLSILTPPPPKTVVTNREPIRFDGPENAAPMQVVADWKSGLPVFKDQRMLLRELVTSDAESLLTMLSTDDVAKFISPPPKTPQGFAKFVQWVIREREAGRQMTFGMVPEGYDHAVGLVQVRALEPSFTVAEWGFALGSPFWGSGLFAASARTTLDFAFLHTALNRVEARACVGNDRGNGALRKMGAVQEGVLRDALRKDGKFFDQIMWSIIARDWFQAKAVWDGMIH
jgi:ribosomal-protein-alanine N-acetyltransferase